MDICPSDSILIETYFDEGSLGVSLKFRSNEGIGFISAIIPNSQAINKNVQQDDELWAVGSQIIGLNRLEKPDWNRLIDFIPKSIRPLRMVWRRRRDMMTALDYENEAKSTGTAKRRPSGTQQNSFPSSLAVPQRRPSTEAPSPGKPRSRSSSPTPLNFSNLQSRNFSAGGGGGSNTSSGKSIILTPKTVEQLEADHRAKAGEVIQETQTQQLTDMASRYLLFIYTYYCLFQAFLFFLFLLF